MDDHQRRYQVFVSSTFRDLLSERMRVVEAVLQIGGFPAGMELFPAATDEQWAFIKGQIESSDYYIIIVGGRYGSLAPDGVSFTEKEYDYALELKIPVMAFLRRDITRLKPNHLETDKTLAKRLVRFRKKVSAGKLIKFYDNPDELKGETWHALSIAFKTHPRRGWMRARVPPEIGLKLPIRPIVGEIIEELSRTSRIIGRLVYVVMSMEGDGASARFHFIASECERLKFVAIHLREVQHRVVDPLNTIHDLIGKANFVIFDLSWPDPDVTYQLGVQRGFGEIDEDGVLLITDDALTLGVSYAPFPVQPISGESDLRKILRDRLLRLAAALQ